MWTRGTTGPFPLGAREPARAPAPGSRPGQGPGRTRPISSFAQMMMVL
jgi:hypothetical protein